MNNFNYPDIPKNIFGELLSWSNVKLLVC